MYRLERSHLFLHQDFRGGPARAAVQNVLQSLRWDPLDDRLIALPFDPACRERPYATGGRHRRDGRHWRLTAGPALHTWAETNGLNWLDGSAWPVEGCWLVELSCCSLPRDGRDEAAIARYRAGGGRSLFAGDDGFYWCSSYHLAVAGEIGPAREDAGDGWHAEGGRYARAPGPSAGASWLRRRRPCRSRDDDDLRPADQFDPRAVYRFEGMDNNLAFDLGPAAQPLPLKPLIARLAYLAPWPINPLLRQPKSGGPSVAEGRPLAAWFEPCPDRCTMTWQISPPLVY